jgi:hypothetical protein
MHQLLAIASLIAVIGVAASGQLASRGTSGGDLLTPNMTRKGELGQVPGAIGQAMENAGGRAD